MGMLQGGLLSQDAGGVPPSYTLQIGDPVFDEIQAEVNAGFGSATIKVYGDHQAGGRQGEIWYSDPQGDTVQHEASTNWIIPNTDATEENWWCRFTNMTGDTGELSGNAAGGAWIDLSTATCSLNLNDPSEPGQYQVDGDVEIRIDTGSPEVVGTFFIAAETEEEEKGK
jgi:hypothetical protein